MKNKPLLYRVGRFILGPIFRWYYNPTIIGSENLECDGSMIIASNHVHLYDQCSIIISTKNIINYMAKKEYFDSWKTRWFFNSVGCIPVDRTKKDNNAVSSALNVLNNGGIIGIFPEGTRNALKEERIKDIYDTYFKEFNYEEFRDKLNNGKPKLSQIKYLLKLYDDKRISKDLLDKYIFDSNKSLRKLVKDKVITNEEYNESLLLPFKFGAVSMASKTNSYIVPVGISGDYKFRSKNLKIVIGKPFKVNNDDLEESNNKLFMEIKDMIKNNQKK